MQPLQQIKNQVALKLTNSHKEIILGVYKSLVHSHNDLCGCNYCKVLEKYIHQKRSLHAIQRKMQDQDQDYPYYNSRETGADYINILMVSKNIERLKEEKDELKKI